MKKFYTLIFLLCGIFLFAQQKNNPNKQPHYTADQLNGFDRKAAWQKALQKSQKPFEQKEYFSSLERQYVQSKIIHGTQVIHANLPYSISGSANKTIINLSPYSSYCPNADFSSANFSNWTGGTYDNSSGTNWNTFTPAWVPGVVSQGNNNPAQPATTSSFGTPTVRHTILSIPPTVNNPPTNCIGWDSITINPSHISDIPFVPPTGGGVTCRLGNANPNYETEELTYVMNVSNQNSQFTYAYAVVLYDGTHASGEQPFFKVTMRDASGNLIAGCGQYQVDATLVSTDPTFHKASYYDSFNNGWVDGTNPSWYADIYYKKWTMVGVDLTAYVGQNVNISFQTADCIYGGHWGYAYIDATCSPAVALVNMCQGLNTQQVVGPQGYVSYQWYGPNSSTLAIPAPAGTKDTLTVSNGVVGDIYYVKAVSANGCITTMQAILQYSHIDVLYSNSTPSCLNGGNGTADVTATGSPTGNYTYNWTNSGGQNVGSAQQVTGLSPGTYSVHVASTVASCGSFDTTVVVGIAPAVTLNQTKNFCGSAAYLTAPAGSTGIQWYAPGGVIIPAPQGTNDTLLATGASNNQVYTVTYTGSGCKDSLLIKLTQVSGGTLSHTGLTNVCIGNTNGNATINLSTTASPPYNYSITGPAFSNSYPASTNTVIPLSGLSFGSYTVAAFDGTCFYSDIFKIDTISVPVNISVAPTVLCSNNMALLTFTFNSAPPTQCQTTTTPCTNPALFTCGPSNTVTPSSYSYPTPYGNYYTKMRAQYIYTASELNTAGITAGNISSIAFNVTNLNGTITSYPNFNISVGCSGQSTFTSLSDETSLISGLTNVYSNASVNVTTGVNTYNFTQPYSWDGSSNLIVDVCFEVPGTYSYTSNAMVSCTSTGNYSSLTIVSDTDPTCNISSSPTAYYYPQPIQMRPVATFGWCNAAANSTMYTYNLNPNTGVLAPGLQPAATTSIQPTATTFYKLTTTSNYGGCQKIDTFTIFVTPPFGITTNRDTLLCTNFSPLPVKATFTDNTTNNTIPESALWSIIPANHPGLSNDNGAGMAIFNPSTSGAGTYSLVVTAGGQCVVTDTFVVKVDTFNTAKFTTTDSVFCKTDPSVQLHPTTAGGIWSGNGVSANGIFSPFSPSVIAPAYVTVTYSVNSGTPCADTYSSTLKIFGNPTVSFSNDTNQGCAPNTTIWFSSSVNPAANTGSYIWYFSDGKTATTPSTSHLYAIPGVYSPKLVYIDANGCRDSTTHIDSITVHAKPTASFYANPGTTDILSPHIDFINTTQPSNCTWAWDIGGLDTSTIKNPSYNFDEPGNFIIQLTVTDKYKCKDVYSIDLKISGAYALYVPTGFTPNGDGKNEQFKPDGFGLSDMNIGYKMEIFDRWGQRLFETGDVNTGWDGSKNGVALAQDIYVYSITFKDYQGKSHSQKGQVTLIR